MKTTSTPQDLFFTHLRDMLSMEIQLLDALPRLIALGSDPLLREVITGRLESADIQLVEIVEFFVRFGKSPGCDDCMTIRSLILGGEARLKAVPHRPTRDLMMVAHCLQITQYTIAACEITARLAGRLGLFTEARTLGRILARETETANALRDLESGIFQAAHSFTRAVPA